MASQIAKACQGTQASCLYGTRASSLRDLKPTLALCRVYGDRITCCAGLPFRIFYCDIPDLPRDRDRLERIRTRKLLQKFLNLCGFVVLDNHINLSLAR